MKMKKKKKRKEKEIKHQTCLQWHLLPFQRIKWNIGVFLRRSYPYGISVINTDK